MLPACPLSHHKLQGRFASRSWEATQELQQRFQLSVHQMSKHHDQRLKENRGVCFRKTDSIDTGGEGIAQQVKKQESGAGHGGAHF